MLTLRHFEYMNLCLTNFYFLSWPCLKCCTLFPYFTKLAMVLKTNNFDWHNWHLHWKNESEIKCFEINYLQSYSIKDFIVKVKINSFAYLVFQFDAIVAFFKSLLKDVGHLPYVPVSCDKMIQNLPFPLLLRLHHTKII